MLGLMLLAGISVNNSILYVDYFNLLTRQNPETSVKRNLIICAKQRFRPIMITTLTSILGMLPLAINWDDSSVVMQSLGLVGRRSWGIDVS